MFRRNVLSLDIGTYNTKIAIGKESQGIVTISKLINFRTPEDTVRDGEIIDEEKLTSVLSKHIQKNRLVGMRAICTFQDRSSIIREFVLPVVKDDEVDSMIRFELEQFQIFNINESIIQYKEIERVKEEDGAEKKKYFVIAVRRQTMEKYYNLLKNIKLNPVVMDLTSNTIEKLFSDRDNFPIPTVGGYIPEIVAIINLGHRYTLINIICKGIPHFSRIIEIGGEELTVQLVNHFNLSYEVAEKKKQLFCDITVAEEDCSEELELYNHLIKDILGTWVEKIQRIFNFYSSRTNQNQIEVIYLHGGTSQLKGIETYFEDRLTIPTLQLEEMMNIKAKEKAYSLYLPAIGAITRK